MKRSFLIGFIILTLVAPLVSFAGTAPKQKFYYGAWLPFWRAQDGAADVSVNLDKLQEVSPFSYEIGPNGGLIDDLNISNGSWDPWFSSARDLGVKIIPTVAWFDGASMLRLMQNTKKRQAHEDMLAALVKREGFDGIDIDYEAKPAEIRPYFSLFIQGMAMRLHPLGKKLTCTVESRTPPADDTVILPEERANNYVVLNQYCDEVRLMAYDQGVVDRQLDSVKGASVLYAPVADPAWVLKVVQQALLWIKPNKIMLGIPSYGYGYRVTWNSGITTYQRVRSFTFTQAMARADEIGVAPVRNNAGELSLLFTSTTAISPSASLTWNVSSSLPRELTTIPLAYGSPTPPAPNTTSTFYISFSDSQSMLDKINLAKNLNLRGVIFFKADGMMDPGIWDYLK